MKTCTSNRFRTRKGMTLIELLAAMLIISILSALGVAIGVKVYNSTKKSKTETTIQIVMSALERYYDVHGEYPISLSTLTGSDEQEVLTILRELPDDAWKPGDEEIMDGYNMKLNYYPPSSKIGLGGRPVIISGGADGRININVPTDEVNEDNIRSDTMHQ